MQLPYEEFVDGIKGICKNNGDEGSFNSREDPFTDNIKLMPGDKTKQEIKLEIERQKNQIVNHTKAEVRAVTTATEQLRVEHMQQDL